MISERLYGRISSNGKPLLSGMERFYKLFSENKGKKIIWEAIILEGNTNEHHIWYIIKMIVPAFIQGNLNIGNVINAREALEEIQSSCGIFQKEKGFHSIFDFNNYKPDCSLSLLELELAIEYLHNYCLDNFNIVIGNTKIFRK